MEQRFDTDDARRTGKRPAAAADKLGGDDKRLRVGSLAEPLHLDQPWTNGTLSLTDPTLGPGFGSAAWPSSQWLYSYPGSSLNAASSDSVVSTPLPPLSSLGLFDVDHYDSIIGQPGAPTEPLIVPISDGTANRWTEVTFSDDTIVPVHQSMSGFDDWLSTPDTHAAFTPSAALIPELASLPYTPETGDSVSSLVKAEEVGVDDTTGPTPLSSSLAPSPGGVNNRVAEAVGSCSVPTPQQKQHEFACEIPLVVEGDHGGSPTEISHDVCFGVVSLNDGWGLKSS